MKKNRLLALLVCMVLSISLFSNTQVMAQMRSGSAHPYFSSGSPQDTHQFIVRNALRILENDKGSTNMNSASITNLIGTYADWPDVLGNETDYATFAGHFYDPDTGKNWMGQTSPTAKTRAQSYYNQAVSLYRQGKVNDAFICLGKGSHYVADINEPHHASNLTAVNSNHSKFEKYVNNNLSSYKISGYTLSNSVYKQAESSSISSMLQSGAKYAKALVPQAKNKDTYEAAAKACVQHAILNEVQYFYKFAKTVGIY